MILLITQEPSVTNPEMTDTDVDAIEDQDWINLPLKGKEEFLDCCTDIVWVPDELPEPQNSSEMFALIEQGISIISPNSELPPK